MHHTCHLATHISWFLMCMCSHGREEWSNTLGVECIIYGKKKSQDEDLDRYYRNLVEILTEEAKKNKIEGLKINWKSIVVKDTGIDSDKLLENSSLNIVYHWLSYMFIF